MHYKILNATENKIINFKCVLLLFQYEHYFSFDPRVTNQNPLEDINLEFLRFSFIVGFLQATLHELELQVRDGEFP